MSTDVGARSRPLLRSHLADHGAYLAVRYGSDWGRESRPPTARGQSSDGTVRAQRADLAGGSATATLMMHRPGVAVLSASYDPGWTATVNGRRRPTRMVAPALDAVDVPAGTDHVVFHFSGYGGYPWLLALSGLTLVLCWVAPVRARRRRNSASDRGSARGAAPAARA
jgi:Bacterial membrane protein YfhO